jgi:hypothetical protein
MLNQNIKRALLDLKCTLGKGHFNSLTGLFFGCIFCKTVKYVRTTTINRSTNAGRHNSFARAANKKTKNRLKKHRANRKT